MKHLFTLGITVLLSVNCSLRAQSLNFEYFKQIGTQADDNVYKMITDISGDIYIMGEFMGTLDVDPGPALHNITSVSTGFNDVYVLKLDLLGDFQWVAHYGGPHGAMAGDMVLDGSGQVYLGLSYRDSIDADPNSSSQHMLYAGTGNAINMCVIELDANRSFQNAVNFNSPQCQVNIVDLKTDATHNIYIAGTYVMTTDFDPGAGVSNHSSSGYNDVFALKLDSTGVLQWVGTINGPYPDWVFGLEITSIGSVAIGCSVNASTTFNFGSSSISYTPAGGQETGIILINPGGSMNSYQFLGASSSTVLGRATRIDAFGNIYIAGQFTGILDFDPGAGTQILTSAGQDDGFILKLSPTGAFIWVSSFSGPGYISVRDIVVDSAENIMCQGLFMDSVDIDPSPGVYKLYTLPANWNGGDMFFVKLDQNGGLLTGGSFQGYEGPTPSGIGLQPGNKIILAGAHKDSTDFDPGPGIANGVSLGSKDVFIVCLKECLSSNASISPVACSPYISPSGLYSWTASGIYADTLVNSCGSDSIITINLTIKPVDTTVTVNWGVFSANASPATYQWLDCDNGYAIISGEIAKDFIPVSNGSYAVAVTQDGCVDTSNCHTIMNVGITETFRNEILVYPNPSTGMFFIRYNDLNITDIRICNSLGENIDFTCAYGNNGVGVTLDAPAGIFFIYLDSEKGSMVRQLMLLEE